MNRKTQIATLARVLNTLLVNRGFAKSDPASNTDNRIEFNVRAAIAAALGVDLTDLALALDDLREERPFGVNEDQANAAFVLTRVDRWAFSTAA